jgi:hypothetical protein
MKSPVPALSSVIRAIGVSIRHPLYHHHRMTGEQDLSVAQPRYLLELKIALKVRGLLKVDLIERSNSARAW